MPRTARYLIPLTIVHVIIRFQRGEYILDDDASRSEYLARLGRALRQVDWKLISYALMSTHIHLAFIVGSASLAAWAQGLHTGFARWVNSRRRRKPRSIGAVFAGRPETRPPLPASRAPWLVAYHHNNPVRARVVASAEESSWTSHRAFMGLCPAPSFLHFEEALELCGFGADQAGRAAFGRFVARRADDHQDPSLSAAGGEGNVDLTLPQHADGDVDSSSLVLVGRSKEDPVEAAYIVEVAASTAGTTAGDLRSRRRDRRTSLGRRVAVGLWLELGRRPGEIAHELRVGPSAVSQIAARIAGDARTGELVARARASLAASRRKVS